MNKQVTKIRKILVLILMMCAFVFSTSAQMTVKKKGKKRAIVSSGASNNSSTFLGCSSNLAYKNGEVFSVAPGILTTRVTSDRVTISVKKTGGRAETQVNIYVNNRFTKKIEFDNGNYTTQYKKRVLTGVKGKNIKVEIVNQSVTNTFKYTAKIVGKRKSITEEGKSSKGSLIYGQMKKTIKTVGSCTGKTKVTIVLSRRRANIARGTIRVYKKSGSSWVRILSETIERNQSRWNHTFNTNKKLKIELKNISIGHSITYTMNALAVN